LPTAQGGLPAGGTTGQILSKINGTDYNTHWTAPASGAAWGTITGTLSDQTDLQSALDAKQDTITQLSLSHGGTAANLTDPAANRLWGWDDTDNAIKFITIGSNLSYDHSTHTLSATGGGATAFTDLSDVPNSYTGQSSKVVAVNGTEDGLVFISLGTFSSTFISNTAYASSWDGVTTVAPSKNAVYDWGHTFDTNDNGKVNVLDLAAGVVATNSSGVVSLASSTDIIGLFTSCSGTQYLGADGACHNASSVTPAALTKTDDTNVTLTLGGTPATALLQATSLTLGWTGTLAAGRGGTGVSSLGNLTDAGTDGIVVTGGTGAVITSTSLAQHVADTTHNGYLNSTDWNTFNGKSTVTPAALTKTDDTNVTLTLGGTPATALLQAASLTLGWTGTLAAARGGTGVSSLGSITKTDDTNVTLALGGTPTGAVINSTSFTLGWTGTLSVARGGTGAGTLTGLVLGNGTSAMTAVTAPSGAVVGTTDTQTLTNKRINPRVLDTNVPSSPVTPASDDYDMIVYRGIGAALTLNAPSGTPVQGQKLIIRFKDDGTARALTWTTGSSGNFRASSDLALPTTTVLSKTLYCGFIYNSTDSRWDLLAVLNNF
jgi:hypothetical protein